MAEQPTLFATDYCDLNEVIARNLTRNLPRTDSSYRLVIHRFAQFQSLLYPSLCRENFSDSKVALFFHDVGVRSQYHISSEKTCCAALKSQFQSICLPNFRSFPDQYWRRRCPKDYLRGNLFGTDGAKYPLIKRVLQVSLCKLFKSLFSWL